MLREILRHVTGFFVPRARTAVVSERRQLVRVRCHLPVQVKYKGQIYTGWILDMGPLGLRLRIDTTMIVGAEVEMRVLSSDRVPWMRFRVLWVHPERKTVLHGLTYDEPEAQLRRSWVGQVFRELGINDRRTPSRRKYLRVDGRIPLAFTLDPTQVGAAPQVEMVNIGVGGLLLRSKHPLMVGLKGQVTLGPWDGLPAAGPYLVEIISAKPDDTGLHCLAALRFLSSDGKLVQSVGRYVVKLLRD